MSPMSNPLVAKFHRKLRWNEKTRESIEAQFDCGNILKRDIETVYEGLFLRTVVAFEDLVENTFFDILEGNSPNPDWWARIEGDKRALRECVLEGKDYLDWLPFKRTLDRAKTYLEDGEPFSLFDDGDRSKLSQIITVRNAIAHAGNNAREKFRNKVIGGTNLRRTEKSPAGFLRSIARTSPDTTRFQIYAQSLGSIALKLN
jgi:hypothetical protein